MVFKNCKKWQFLPQYEANSVDLKVVKEMEVLEIVLRSEMQLSSNTKYMEDKAYMDSEKT